MDALVIVEGFNDCLAVHRAVRCPVFVLGGGYALADAMKPELQYLGTLSASGQLPRQMVVFMDPDWQGRMFRTYLDEVLPPPAPPSSPAAALAAATAPAGSGSPPPQPSTAKGPLQPRTPRAVATGSASLPGGQGGQKQQPKGPVVRHAFLRVELGTSEESSKYHDAGNVGVEHAAPDTIRACLRRARRGFGAARKDFSQDELRADGLVGSWDNKEVSGPALRRKRFCQALGIDDVGTGKALVNLLNRFFTREEYVAALQAANELQ